MKTGRRIIVGITGASGSLYARMLVERLLCREEVAEVAVVYSRNGRLVTEYELGGIPVYGDPRIREFARDDMFAAPASGSAGYDSMAVIPCSMGTAARIAAGTSDNLLCRAADVMLKERRRLVVVPREMPLGTIHLRNLLTLSECGAVVIPASPSFYSMPQDAEQLCATVVDRVMSQLDIAVEGFRWGGE